MDYLCAKFGDWGLSRFGFIVLTSLSSSSSFICSKNNNVNQVNSSTTQ